MDLNDEKEKAKFIYKLELRKLLIDKMLFGAIIVLIGVSANIVLERYRSGLTQERYLIEKKFKAIHNIKASYEELFELFDSYTVDPDKYELPNDHRKKYNQKYDAFVIEANKWNIVLPQEFEDKLNYLTWIHGGIDYKGVEVFRSMDWDARNKHRAFMSEVRKYFYNLCKETLGLENKMNEQVFILEEMSFSEASNIGAEAYYDKNYNNWTQNKR
ncbi:MAG: hypothetical protein GY777_26475 [Candidatus Brocadiaceae bacterium]|nr:hypothetical protein [Candidatus Brocadiaceae bacterium]